MPIQVACALENCITIQHKRTTPATKNVPVSINNTVAVPLDDYQANEVGVYVVFAPKMIATANNGTFNAGTGVALNPNTPATNVSVTAAGLRNVGVCLKDYGLVPIGTKIEISFDGRLPRGV